MPTSKRSQAILRMPIDMVDAVMILHDGVRSDVLLLIPPSEDISRLMTEGAQFVPVVDKGVEHLVARAAIACFGVPHDRAPRLDDDFPATTQRATVRLRSGVELDGELRWLAPFEQRRTTDYLNSDTPYVVIYGGAVSYIVAKAHIAQVIER